MIKNITPGVLLQVTNMLVFGAVFGLLFSLLKSLGLWDFGIAMFFGIFKPEIFLGIFVSFIIITQKITVRPLENFLIFIGFSLFPILKFFADKLLDPSSLKPEFNIGILSFYAIYLTLAVISALLGYFFGVAIKRRREVNIIPEQQNGKFFKWFWRIYLLGGITFTIISLAFSMWTYFSTQKQRNVENPSNLSPEPFSSGPLLYVYSNHAVVGASSEPAISIFDTNGKNLKTLLLGGKIIYEPSALISSDKKFIVLVDRSNTPGDNKIGVIDTSSHSLTKLVDVKDLVSSVSDSLQPVLIKNLVLIPTSTGKIITFDLEKMGTTKVTNLGALGDYTDLQSYAFSESGQYVFVSSTKNNSAKLTKIDLSSGNKILEKDLPSKNPGIIGLTKSASGEFIYYLSDELGKGAYLNIVDPFSLYVKKRIFITNGTVNNPVVDVKEGKLYLLEVKFSSNPLYVVDLNDFTVKQSFSLKDYPVYFWIGKDVIYTYHADQFFKLMVLDKRTGNKIKEIELNRGSNSTEVFEIN